MDFKYLSAEKFHPRYCFFDCILFGAGEQMAALAERGSARPALSTSGIALVLWTLYAFSAAGLIGRLPLLRLVLVLMTGIYLTRGLAGFIFIGKPLGRSREFRLWSPAICLIFGVVHLMGLRQR